MELTQSLNSVDTKVKILEDFASDMKSIAKIDVRKSHVESQDVIIIERLDLNEFEIRVPTFTPEETKVACNVDKKLKAGIINLSEEERSIKIVPTPETQAIFRQYVRDILAFNRIHSDMSWAYALCSEHARINVPSGQSSNYSRIDFLKEHVRFTLNKKLKTIDELRTYQKRNQKSPDDVSRSVTKITVNIPKSDVSIMIGLDHDSSRVFICQLRKNASTVAQGFRNLIPEKVRKHKNKAEIKRQGEYYFLPVKTKKILREIEEQNSDNLTQELGDMDFDYDDSFVVNRIIQIRLDKFEIDDVAENPHLANNIITITPPGEGEQPQCFVKGYITSPFHKPLWLSEWHEVIHNEEVPNYGKDFD